MKPKRTEKQKILMGIILRAMNEGKYLTMKDLFEACPYDCSYGAIRVSVRFLERQGMLVKQKNGQFTELVPTDRAFDWFRPRYP